MLNLRLQLHKRWASWETCGSARIVYGQPATRQDCGNILRQNMSNRVVIAALSVTSSVPLRMLGTFIKVDITKAVEINDWKYSFLLNMFLFRRSLGRNTEKNFPTLRPRARKL